MVKVGSEKFSQDDLNRQREEGRVQNNERKASESRRRNEAESLKKTIETKPLESKRRDLKNIGFLKTTHMF